jgi:hypothetical protein
MTAASRAEDGYGVVLMCEPLLPDVLRCLLSVILTLQQYTKQEVRDVMMVGVWGCGVGVCVHAFLCLTFKLTCCNCPSSCEAAAMNI